MRDKIKNLDKRLTIVIWMYWILLVVASYLFAVKLTAPEFEIVSGGTDLHYVLKNGNGELIQSRYKNAWQHNFMKAPRAVLYDTDKDKAVLIKDEHYRLVVARMDKSKYSGLIYHAKWLWFLVMFTLATVFVAVFCNRLRDRIVCNEIKRNPDFLSCTYFLQQNRIGSTKKEILALIPQVSDKYIESRKNELEQNYSPALYSLIMFLLGIIKESGSTIIRYRHVFKNDLIGQREYLKKLISNCGSQVCTGVTEKEHILYDKELLKKDYVEFPKLRNKASFTQSVSDQLNILFAQIMGTDIFRFVDNPIVGSIAVTTTLENSVGYVSMQDNTCEAEMLPEVNINVLIEKRHTKTNDAIMNDFRWSICLSPDMNQSISHSNFNIEEFYVCMILQTLNSMASEMMKN